MGTLELPTNAGWSAPQIVNLDCREAGIRGRQHRCIAELRFSLRLM
jgi:hypothetical protein